MELGEFIGLEAEHLSRALRGIGETDLHVEVVGNHGGELGNGCLV